MSDTFDLPETIDVCVECGQDLEMLYGDDEDSDDD